MTDTPERISLAPSPEALQCIFKMFWQQLDMSVAELEGFARNSRAFGEMEEEADCHDTPGTAARKAFVAAATMLGAPEKWIEEIRREMEKS